MTRRTQTKRGDRRLVPSLLLLAATGRSEPWNDDADSTGFEKEVGDSKIAKSLERPRVTLLGLEELSSLEERSEEPTSLEESLSGIVGLGSDDSRWNYERLHANDLIEDSIFDPLSPDPSCVEGEADCWRPPDSTVEEEPVWNREEKRTLENVARGYGGADPDDATEKL